jgi:hypothetical protein
LKLALALVFFFFGNEITRCQIVWHMLSENPTQGYLVTLWTLLRIKIRQLFLAWSTANVRLLFFFFKTPKKAKQTNNDHHFLERSKNKEYRLPNNSNSKFL